MIGHSIALLVVSVACYAQAGPVVHTVQGPVEGKSLEILGKPYNEFLGIPFAKPPVGALRFKAPIYPPDSWEITYDASYKRASCVQDMAFQKIPGPMSEDCLYLNVYQPTGGSVKDLAVIVWIYGGSFVSGSATLYNGNIISTIGDVVVVTLNYRLGALGFLSTSDDVIYGNAGLRDQAAALQWVQDNIAFFNGDPKKITLAGESAGSASVNFHILSPISRHLFTRAISESGSATGNAFQVAAEARDAIDALCKLLGCGTNSTQTMAHCLYSKTTNEILSAQNEIYNAYNNRMLNLAFRPVVDGEFLPRHPIEMLRDGDFKRCEYITGINADEYSLFLLIGGDFEKISLYGINSTYFDDVLIQKCKRSLIDGQGPPNAAMRNALRYKYTNWAERDNDIERRQEFIKLWSDSTFICPMIRQAPFFSNATNMAEGAKLYMYEFTHADGRYEEWMGVPHASEIAYVFGVPLVFPETGTVKESPSVYTWTAADKTVSRYFINMWTDFAKTGEPLAGTWLPYNTSSMPFLVIDEHLGIGNGLYADRCAAWLELLPQLESECSGS